jgi:hypothetical protein
MELSGYRGSSSGERVSERSRENKSGGGSCLPPTPNGMGTGLLSRPESVRVRPAARNRDQGGKL